MKRRDYSEIDPLERNSVLRKVSQTPEGRAELDSFPKQHREALKLALNLRDPGEPLPTIDAMILLIWIAFAAAGLFLYVTGQIVPFLVVGVVLLVFLMVRNSRPIPPETEEYLDALAHIKPRRRS